MGQFFGKGSIYSLQGAKKLQLSSQKLGPFVCVRARAYVRKKEIEKKRLHEILKIVPLL